MVDSSPSCISSEHDSASPLLWCILQAKFWGICLFRSLSKAHQVTKPSSTAWQGLLIHPPDHIQ